MFLRPSHFITAQTNYTRTHLVKNVEIPLLGSVTDSNLREKLLVCFLCFLQEVQSLLLNWKGPDLTTYGELVLEGTFKVYRAKNERTLFLFDRMLLITKRRGEHFVYKTHISVRNCATEI